VIETPRSLFGKVPYVREQAAIYMAMRDASRAAFIIIPEAVGALEIPLEKELAIDIWRTRHLPKIERDRVLGRKYLSRMKEKLVEIGV
jgi:hypothetical protein